MNGLALSLLGLGTLPASSGKTRTANPTRFTGNVTRERIEKITAILADDLGHDTASIAQCIGAKTKHTQQALTEMCDLGMARKVGIRACGMSRVSVWRKA